MNVSETGIPGLKIIQPDRHSDSRGYFSESWNRRKMSEAGIDFDFVQDNFSLSVEAGTIRGLHYQAPPHAQAKLVRCGRGRLFDVAVDIRKGSPTYGKWFGIELTQENGTQLLVPEGFLHGFATMERDTEMLYKVSDHYSRECDGSVLWNSCGIEWPIEGAPKLSAKDETAVPFSEFDSPFEWTSK